MEEKTIQRDVQKRKEYRYYISSLNEDMEDFLELLSQKVYNIADCSSI